MSWRARSSVARGERIGNHAPQRSKTAISKSKEERNQEREVLIGWEGHDTYLQFEPIGIDVWEKRSSKPKPVLTKHKEDDVCLPWQFYLCWTYTKCSTIPDYELFVTDSLATKFKPYDEGAIDEDEGALQDTEITVQSNATASHVQNGRQSPTSVCVELETMPNGGRDDMAGKYKWNIESRAITQPENGAMGSQKECGSCTPSTNRHDTVVDDTLISKPVLNPVLSLADSRQSSISHSAPTLRTFDRIESERRVSSAETAELNRLSTSVLSNRGLQETVQQGKGITTKQQNTGNISASTSDKMLMDPVTNVHDDLITNVNDPAQDRKTGDVIWKAANILESLRLETVQRDIGFDLPQATHVSLGDLFSSTPRLQRRLGTAKGRDPQVYAALHGKDPSPRPATPEPNMVSKSPSNSNTLDFDTEVSPRSPHSPSQHHESELPPVKHPKSPRGDNGSSPKSASPNGSQDGTPLPYVPSINENGRRGKVAHLSYRKTSDTCVPYRCGDPNRDVAIQDHHDSSPSTRDVSPRMYENGDVRKIVKTRGPPGFRPQGQKTPLHRAMENAHKKLYGQHYHLFTQANYGQYGQQEKQRRAVSGSAHGPSSQRGSSKKAQETTSHIDNNTWPQQLESRIRQYRSTTAPIRRMYHGTSTAPGGASSSKHAGHKGDYHSNSKYNRKISAHTFLGGDSGQRRYSSTDINDNTVSLRGKLAQN